METFAQKRSRLNKLREIVNKPVGALKKFFDPEFEPLWEKMGEVDEQIREEAENLKEYIKVAKTNFNRREYMTAIRFLGSFHDQIEKIDKQLAALLTSVDVKHHEFLFGDLDPDDLKYLTEQLGSKFDKRPPAQKRASIEKEAELTDWWHNISTDRGRQLGAWEKRFSKDAKELKRQTANLVNKSEQLYNVVISSFKQLASYYATRKIEDYLKLSEKLRQRFKAYTTTFDNYYNTYVKKYIEIQKSMQSLPDADLPAAEEIKSTPTPEPSSNIATPDKDLPSFSPPAPSQILSDMPSTSPSEPPQFPKPISGLVERLQNKTPEPIAAKNRPELLFQEPSSNFKPNEVADKVSDIWKNYESPNTETPTIPIPQSKTPGQTMISPGVPMRRTVPYQSPGAAAINSDEIDLSNPILPKPPVMPNIRYDEPDEKEAARFIQYKPDQNTKETVAPLAHKKNHKEFLDNLIKLSSEHPMVIASNIIKYAKIIKATDFEMSEKLLKIAKNILNS